MSNSHIYLTREGRQKLEQELYDLKSRGRQEAAGRIAEARSHGDLKENAEYDAAKEAQGMLEMRISKIEETLSKSREIDVSQLDNSKILILSVVTLKDLKKGNTVTYTLVSPEEADFAENKISTTSPIGKALLGHSVGDKLEIKVPAGIISYEVLEISR